MRQQSLAKNQAKCRRIEDQKAQTEIGRKQSQRRRNVEPFKRTKWRIQEN